MESIGGKTLQEIQDLPWSEMRCHMREHVDPKWQSWSDTDGKIRAYNVKVELILTTSENQRFQIQAHSKEEADELAETHIQDNFEYDDYEIYDLSEAVYHH